MLQLHDRFNRNEIYTYMGKHILICVNPFRVIPICLEAQLEKFRNAEGLLHPHIYAMAARALNRPPATSPSTRKNEEAQDQVFVVFGGQNSGKTQVSIFIAWDIHTFMLL